jgi:hypothetical protein
MFQAFGIGKTPLGPDDIVMVQGLVKEYCASNGVDCETDVGREAARHLLSWFQSGITDRNRLRELLASRNI